MWVMSSGFTTGSVVLMKVRAVMWRLLIWKAMERRGRGGLAVEVEAIGVSSWALVRVTFSHWRSMMDPMFRPPIAGLLEVGMYYDTHSTGR
jgi:hypothetical protein